MPAGNWADSTGGTPHGSSLRYGGRTAGVGWSVASGIVFRVLALGDKTSVVVAVKPVLANAIASQGRREERPLRGSMRETGAEVDTGCNMPVWRLVWCQVRVLVIWT